MMQDRRLKFGALGFLLAAAPLFAAPKRTPTPTPTRRLSGGFGRQAVEPDEVRQDPDRSLADTARAARRTPRAPTSIAITNSTLLKEPGRKKAATTPSPRPTSAPGAGTSPPPSAYPDPASPEQAEAYWREKTRTIRERVAKLKEKSGELEAQSAKLQDDFYSWDDGQYRDTVIKPALDRKRQELETTRRELAAAEKDLAELPERARKAGALPGWLRDQ